MGSLEERDFLSFPHTTFQWHKSILTTLPLLSLVVPVEVDSRKRTTLFCFIIVVSMPDAIIVINAKSNSKFPPQTIPQAPTNPKKPKNCHTVLVLVTEKHQKNYVVDVVIPSTHLLLS